MARFWYAYNAIGDPQLASSYNLTSVKPGCINGSRVCAIYSPGATTPSTPLSGNLSTYIADLLTTLIARPDASLGVKKYVYGKA